MPKCAKVNFHPTLLRIVDRKTAARTQKLHRKSKYTVAYAKCDLLLFFFMGLFRDNTRQRRKHKRKTKQCIWFTAECEKKRKALIRVHKAEVRVQASRNHKKVNEQLRKYHSDLVKKIRG